MEPLLGEIRMFAGNFPPKGWAFCDGRIIPISQNTALFALLGTYYGGNGTSTFALPNLQGRTPLHQGQGPGLTDRTLGEDGGTETVALTTSAMPAHNHAVQFPAQTDFSKTTQSTPVNGAFSAADPNSSSSVPLYASASNATVMGTSPSGATGNGVPHENMQPFLAVSFIIATTGIFPARD